MRLGLSILLSLMLLAGLCGCSVIRMSAMDSIGKSEIPTIAGGKRVTTEVVGWANAPSITVRIESKGTADEVLKWYRERLVAQGWVLRAETEGWTKGYGSMNGNPCYYANRNRWKSGDQWLSKEELELILEDHGERCIVEVKITGDYVWDWPGHALIEGTEKLVEIPGWAMLFFVEKTGGGEVELAILDIPLLVPTYVAMVLF